MFPDVGRLGGLKSDSFLMQPMASEGKTDLGSTCTSFYMGQRGMLSGDPVRSPNVNHLKQLLQERFCQGVRQPQQEEAGYPSMWNWSVSPK